MATKAKDKATNTKAPKATEPVAKRPPGKPSDVKASTQEAKDLRSLVTMLGQKNAPETSKDITAYAKETLKLVAKSQKSDSAAFKREATKALVDFRNFVEGTQKVTELRRAQLLTQIDDVSLDAKNSVMMMLSVAKTQSKNIRLSAAREVAADKLKLQQWEKNLVAETTAKTKALESESKLKSKALSKEQEEKFKLLAEERSARYKALVQKNKDDTAKLKDELKQRKDSHKLKMETDKLELKDAKEKSKQHYDNLKLQLNQNIDARKQAIDKQKQDQEIKNATDRNQIKLDRSEAATKIKKLKSDLRDDYQTKSRKAKDDIKNQTAAMLTKNKERIEKIRLMKTESAAKLKKIEEEASAEALVRKHKAQGALTKIGDKKANANRDASDFNGKLKDGIMEANPLLHASIEIFKGIKGNLDKRGEKKQLNKLTHKQNQPTAKPNATPNATPAPAPATSPAAASTGAGGVAGILGGIGSFFSGIVGAFSKVGSLLLSGARFIPVIATVSAIIGGVWSFIEGFNDASSLFGEKIADDDYTRRIYSGFTNIIGNILGLFDTVAGWLGFDSDLEGSFKDKAVNLFNSILGVFKSVAGGLAKMLKHIPGLGDVADKLTAYAESSGSLKPSEGASAAAAISTKTKTVNDLKDDVEAKKSKGAAPTVVTDNSVKQNSTTIVQPKMETRNNDSSVQLYGYGQPQPF